MSCQPLSVLTGATHTHDPTLTARVPPTPPHRRRVLALEVEAATVPALKQHVEDYKQRVAASASEVCATQEPGFAFSRQRGHSQQNRRARAVCLRVLRARRSGCLFLWQIRELKKELERRGKVADEMAAQQRSFAKEAEAHQQQARTLQQVSPARLSRFRLLLYTPPPLPPAFSSRVLTSRHVCLRRVRNRNSLLRRKARSPRRPPAWASARRS